MKKTTLYLDESTMVGLKELSKAQGRSQSDLIREAVSVFVTDYQRPKPRGVGAYRSGRSDISERAEELLAERPKPNTPGRSNR